MRHPKRIESVQAQLRKKKIDGLLVSQPHNRRYLSGYTAADHDISESSGVLLVPARKPPLLLTDSRFQLQAEKEADGMQVLLYSKGLLSLLKQLLPDLKIASLAFESHYTLHSTADKLKTMADSIKVRLTYVADLVEKMRLFKDEEEIKKIKASVLLNEKVFRTVYKTIKGGETEIDVALAIESSMRRLGAEAPSFETIVATGERSALPHAVPGDVPIAKDESLMIDMGLILDGYCSDMTRTFVPRQADETFIKRHRLVRKAQLAGMAAVHAGVSAASVDKAARNVIADGGYGNQFGHALGHGVGLAVHEAPGLSSRNRKQLRSGMIITIEPGIYLPGWGGIRLENMVVVREDGYELLNEDTTWLDI